jgi:hypothetical protein
MIRTGSASVAVPGTPEGLLPEGHQDEVQAVQITALPGNAGIVWVGGEDVTEGEGTPLQAWDSTTLDGSIELAEIFIDADTADDGVSFTAVS